MIISSLVDAEVRPRVRIHPVQDLSDVEVEPPASIAYIPCYQQNKEGSSASLLETTQFSHHNARQLTWAFGCVSLGQKCWSDHAVSISHGPLTVLALVILE
ncbi:hypothetical protein PoB_004762500 [Plakobranchus ocellatus]|uniref:Uncharacterized protein n=1 Tax=Plakobranchus ocellatus TaxID=259542 RepID=A0AAV4BPT5_9GAST|nr:hypothetical protein PoB_004762500 [Plakobranchus ocellatus]